VTQHHIAKFKYQRCTLTTLQKAISYCTLMSESILAMPRKIMFDFSYIDMSFLAYPGIFALQGAVKLSISTLLIIMITRIGHMFQSED
jgi:hypothetical protein